MLVLSRKVGERIVVNNDIRITVVRISGGGVRIGIEAPHGTPVVREELLSGPLSHHDTETSSGHGTIVRG